MLDLCWILDAFILDSSWIHAGLIGLVLDSCWILVMPKLDSWWTHAALIEEPRGLALLHSKSCHGHVEIMGHKYHHLPRFTAGKHHQTFFTHV